MTELLACERVWLGCRNSSTGRLFTHAPTVFAIAQLLDLEAAGAVVFRDLERETAASISLVDHAVANPLLAHALRRIRSAIDDGATVTRLMWALNAITPNAIDDAMPYLAESGLAIRKGRRLGWIRPWQPDATQRAMVLKEARDDAMRGEFRSLAGRNFLVAASACDYESQLLGHDGLTDSDLAQRLAVLLRDDAGAQAFASIIALTTHPTMTVHSH